MTATSSRARSAASCITRCTGSTSRRCARPPASPSTHLSRLCGRPERAGRTRRSAAPGGEPLRMNGDAQLENVQHVVRREAAPFVLVAAVADLVLAALSAWHGWQLYSSGDWWVWIVLASPAALLAMVFGLGFGRLGVSSGHRRTVAIGLLSVLAVANLTAVVLVLAPLGAGGSKMTGGAAAVDGRRRPRRQRDHLRARLLGDRL